MTEWNSRENLEKHFMKHVLGVNFDNKPERDIWKNIIHVLDINQYERESKSNMHGDSFLYKDDVSRDFSFNYYNKLVNDYLITIVKNKNNNMNIYSCFIKDKLLPFLGIFLFADNLVYENDNKRYIKDFEKNENLNDSYDKDKYIYDKCYNNAVSYSNLNRYNMTNKEKEDILKVNTIISFLIHHKNEINDLLLERLKYNKQNKVPYTYINQINNMVNDTDIYDDNKDTVDLLIDICNFIEGKEVIQKQDNDRWNDLFKVFNNYNA